MRTPWPSILVAALLVAVPAAARVELQTRSDGSIVLRSAGAATGRGATWTTIADSRRALREVILEEARRWRIDPELVTAVIAAESGFNPRAVSRKGAVGLMQLMPATSKRLSVADPYDPGENVAAGTRYLRELLDRFQGSLELALAGYNAGPGAVARYRGIPPYRETRDYVRKVMAIYRAGSKISMTKGGNVYTISPGGRTRVKKAPGSVKPTPTETSRVTSLDEGVSLAKIAAANRQSVRETQEFQSAENTLAGAAERNAARARADEAVVRGPSAKSQTSLEPPHAPPEVAQEEDGQAADTGEPLFYRYTDDNGVTYITRTKPTHDRYEVLRR